MENSLQEDEDELEGKVDNAEKENLPIEEFEPNFEDEATSNTQEHLVESEQNMVNPEKPADPPLDAMPVLTMELQDQGCSNQNLGPTDLYMHCLEKHKD